MTMQSKYLFLLEAFHSTVAELGVPYPHLKKQAPTEQQGRV